MLGLLVLVLVVQMSYSVFGAGHGIHVIHDKPMRTAVEANLITRTINEFVANGARCRKY